MANEFSPESWLKRAESNLTIGLTYNIETLPEQIFLEDLCFELQQCVEKSIKAVLVYCGIDFPRTHNINELLIMLVENTSIIIPENVKKSPRLTRYAVKTRYPNWNKTSKEEFIEAAYLARYIFEWAKEIIYNRK